LLGTACRSACLGVDLPRQPLGDRAWRGHGRLHFVIHVVLVWSRPVNDFLELQSGRDWGEAGGTLMFLLFGVVGLALIVLPRFFADDTSTSWKYHSPEHNFAMTLPSGDWKEIRMEGSDVAFNNRKHAVLVGVNVSHGQEGDYERAVEATRAYFQRASNELQSEPKFAAAL